MNKMISDIKELCEKFGFGGDYVDINNIKFRSSLIEEEATELQTAMDECNPEEFIDANIDLLIVALGNLVILDVDVQKAWDEVHTANMSKERGVKIGRETSGGFDLIKPPSWVPPDHTGNHGKLTELFDPKKRA